MEEEFDFKDYYNMLKSSWLVALIVFIVVLGAVLAYTFTTPKIYQSRSTVLVTNQDQTSFLLGLTSARPDIETQKEIVLSYSVLQGVYQAYPVIDYTIAAETLKNSNIIQITVESRQPSTAMGVANKVAESYIDYTLENKKREASDVSNFISEQLITYKQEMDNLNIQLSQFKNTSNMTATEKNTYQNIQREMAAKSKLYDYLLSRKEETSITVQEKSGSVKIIEYAYMPYRPVKPNMPLNIILGLIIAIIISIGAVFIKSQLNNKVKSIKDVESEFGPSMLGSIPKIKKKEFNKLGQEKGVFAESILALRTSLIFHLEDSKMKVISISSPEESDGKTIITANLALGLAHTGKKVLIVDANLRNPTLHTVFDVPPTAPGLTDAILNNTKLVDYVKKTSHKNLFYLPSGEMHNSPIEIVSSEGMKALFAKLRSTAFDVVLIDNASLEYSESSIICAQSEGTILIIAHDKTEKTHLKKARDLLRKAKAKIIGIVINFSR